MKNSLKIVLIVLIVILLTLIAFVGIYVNNKNILPDYLLGRKLSDSKVIELSVDKTVNKVKYDENGKVVKEDTTATAQTEEGEENKNYKEVEEPVNKEENLNKENYNLVKNILRKRLETLNIADYKVKVNSENGKIIVEIPEDAESEDIHEYLTEIGSFEIVDAEETQNVLINEKDLKNVEVGYNTNNSGATTVYLRIYFNKEGKKKLTDISKTYIKTIDGDDNSVEKKVTLKMEDEEILSTYFGEPLTTGEIQLTVGTATTDVKTIESNLKSAAGVALILNSGKMPLKYNIESEKTVETNITDSVISIAIYVLLGIAILSFIYLIIRYKKYGLLSIFGSIAALDLLLISIRYANVYISTESVIGIVLLIVFNTFIVKNLVSKLNKNMDEEEIKKTMFNGFKKSIDGIVLYLTISVVFTFINWTALSSIGNILFWGIISIGITHLIFTRALLLNSNKK